MQIEIIFAICGDIPKSKYNSLIKIEPSYLPVGTKTLKLSVAIFRPHCIGERSLNGISLVTISQSTTAKLHISAAFLFTSENGFGLEASGANTSGAIQAGSYTLKLLLIPFYFSIQPYLMIS